MKMKKISFFEHSFCASYIPSAHWINFILQNYIKNNKQILIFQSIIIEYQ